MADGGGIFSDGLEVVVGAAFRLNQAGTYGSGLFSDDGHEDGGPMTGAAFRHIPAGLRGGSIFNEPDNDALIGDDSFARQLHRRTRGARAAGPPGRVKQRRWRPLLMLAAAVAAAAVLITSGAVIGASIAGKPPPVPLPPPAQQPPAALAALPPGKRGIVMNQPAGDSRTSFVVFGGGWVPGSRPDRDAGRSGCLAGAPGRGQRGHL